MLNGKDKPCLVLVFDFSNRRLIHISVMMWRREYGRACSRPGR